MATIYTMTKNTGFSSCFPISVKIESFMEETSLIRSGGIIGAELFLGASFGTLPGLPNDGALIAAAVLTDTPQDWQKLSPASFLKPHLVQNDITFPFRRNFSSSLRPQLSSSSLLSFCGCATRIFAASCLGLAPLFAFHFTLLS